jgi:[acyl-carrier-protein] S-malonyltransferase
MSRFAMLFPGQASQSVGMLSLLAEHYPIVGETYDEASAVLGYDMGALIHAGPAEKLDATEYTQPAIVAASIAVWRVWQSLGGMLPTFMAGHSLGEYSALVAAGALDFADALRVTRLRGQAMQAAVAIGEGVIAAVIGLADDAVRAACAQAETEHADEALVVSPANYNAPGQVVISGHAQAVETAGQIAKAQGAKRVVPLAMSVPAHCALMAPAADRLAACLADVPLRPPRVAVLHNIDTQPRENVDDIRKALVDQLVHPVLWTDTVRAIGRGLYQPNGALFVECGPGKVLTGLCKRIDKSARCLPIAEPDTLGQAIGATASPDDVGPNDAKPKDETT